MYIIRVLQNADMNMFLSVFHVFLSVFHVFLSVFHHQGAVRLAGTLLGHC